MKDLAFQRWLWGACLFVAAAPTVVRGADTPNAVLSAAAMNRVDPHLVQLRLIGGASSIDGVPLGRALTGVMLSPDGWVVTTSFGFDPPPTAVIVALPNGGRASARMVAVDHVLKIALLLAEVPETAPSETLSWNSDAIAVGQTVLAVGRSYDAGTPNVARGIVSAVDRLCVRAIQVDAAVSSANYGGPLVDLEGRVLGLLTPLPAVGADRMSAEWYDSGIGFAAPADLVLPAVERLKSGKDQFPGRLGVEVEAEHPFRGRVRVEKLASTGPAKELMPGDLIVALADQQTPYLSAYHSVIGGLYAGQTVNVAVERDGELLGKSVTLTRKEELSAAKKPAPIGGDAG